MKREEDVGGNRLVSAELEDEDVVSGGVEIRPKTLADYIGQQDVKARLAVFIQAARKRGESLDHVLFHGFPGLGKTTLAYIIANEMGAGIKVTSGPVIERAGDLAAILTSLQPGDVLFIDEIHRLNHVVEEILYPAMEDYQLDLVIGQGPGARSVKMDLPRFTLVGATTRAGLLTPPLRDRFGVILRLESYSPEDLAAIVRRSARLLQIDIDESGALEIGRRSRGTPRIANRLLRRVRDFAEVGGHSRITREAADHALGLLKVDPLGLDEMDRRILLTLIEKFQGGPIGLETLSTAVCEEKNTLEDVYEPFLIQSGFLVRTPRGRMATENAYRHFKLPVRAGLSQPGLFEETTAEQPVLRVAQDGDQQQAEGYHLADEPPFFAALRLGEHFGYLVESVTKLDGAAVGLDAAQRADGQDAAQHGHPPPEHGLDTDGVGRVGGEFREFRHRHATEARHPLLGLPQRRGAARAVRGIGGGEDVLAALPVETQAVADGQLAQRIVEPAALAQKLHEKHEGDFPALAQLLPQAAAQRVPHRGREQETLSVPGNHDLPDLRVPVRREHGGRGENRAGCEKGGQGRQVYERYEKTMHFHRKRLDEAKQQLEQYKHRAGFCPVGAG